MIDEVKTERVAGGAEGTIAGSSLLVFSVDPQWGNIYFWLGRERKNTKWPQGSETWSDFGGRPAHEGEDAPTIAARGPPLRADGDSFVTCAAAKSASYASECAGRSCGAVAGGGAGGCGRPNGPSAGTAGAGGGGGPPAKRGNA